MTSIRIALVLLFAALGAVGPGSVARADALVVVRVTGASEGRVTLTRPGGPSYSCQTQNRTCRINGVPGGTYQASFAPATGRPVVQRQPVMIPPSGTATVVVRGG
jgi:hypothetical protein